jgi:hypothetical protein
MTVETELQEAIVRTEPTNGRLVAAPMVSSQQRAILYPGPELRGWGTAAISVRDFTVLLR